MKMPCTLLPLPFKAMATSSPSMLAVAVSAFALLSTSMVHARPSVNGSTIVMPDNGWYQVQDASSYAQLCAGVLSCDVPEGTYIVINHTTGERFENVEIEGASEAIGVVVSQNVISWPDDGWYHVQNAITYQSICEGTRSCVVDEGSYYVINHTTGERWENIIIGASIDPELPTANAPLVGDLRVERYSGTAIELFWSHPDSGEPSGGYAVYQDGRLASNITGKSFFVDDLNANTRYQFDVRAVGQMSGATITVAATNTVVEPIDSADPQTPLRALIPDTERLFGESIDDIPSPIQGDNTELVWTYNVVDEQLSNDTYTAPFSHQLAWESYSNLIPLPYRESLTAVTFFLGTDFYCQTAIAGLGSSGFSNTTPGEAENTLYLCENIVTFNYEASMPENLPEGAVPASPGYFEDIWIHETAHILEALYTVELIEPNANFYDVDMFGSEFPVGQLVARDTYVGQYFREFWLGEVADYYTSVLRQGNVSARMYAEYPTNFISTYAATNFAEDFAETFTYFVTRAEMPVDNGDVRYTKVLYMWSVPELVQMREDIRARSQQS